MTERDRNGTFDESTAPRNVPPRAREDLLLLALLDEEPIRKISEQISSSAAMLSPHRIAEIVKEHLAGDEAEAVARILSNVTPAEIPTALRVVDDWSRRQAGQHQAPSDSTADKLSDNLSLLVQDYPALRVMHKAQRLLREIGNELQSVIFVCDLRPVYDDEHTEVVGFVPLINMQIGYTKQNGAPEFFEATLSGDELRQLVNRGQDALNKLQILEGMLHGPSETDDVE